MKRYKCLKNKLKYVVFVLAFLISSCETLDKETKINIVDSKRFYFPILQGQDLKIIYEIKNVGDAPLTITDILPTCGCIIVDETKLKNIPVDGTIFVKLTYDSNKNIGQVNHFIYLYGNFNKKIPVELSFNVNVVPDALYTKDYEELYRKEVEENANVENLVDGNNNQKGYYTEKQNK
jgi:hypothetical protein